MFIGHQKKCSKLPCRHCLDIKMRTDSSINIRICVHMCIYIYIYIFILTIDMPKLLIISWLRPFCRGRMGPSRLTDLNLSVLVCFALKGAASKNKTYKWSLVGGLVAINFIFPYIGNFIIPIDEVIFFRGVFQPPTRKICDFCGKTIFEPQLQMFVQCSMVIGESPTNGWFISGKIPI